MYLKFTHKANCNLVWIKTTCCLQLGLTNFHISSIFDFNFLTACQLAMAC